MTEGDAVKPSPEPKPKPTTRIIYPVFFAIFPVLSIYSANLSLVPYTMMIRPLGVATAFMLLLWGLLTLILRNAGRAAVAASVLVGMSFGYSRTQSFLTANDIPHEAHMWSWVILTVIVTVLLTWKLRLHKLLNILSVSLVLAAVGQIIYGIAHSASLLAEKRAKVTVATAAAKDLPDILYIILDGYGRSDALKRALNFSNDSFIEGLESRGFYVAKDAHANYCQTELSLASSLNMDLIPTLLPKVTATDEERGPLVDLVDRNAAADYLRGKGYVFAAITSRFPPIQFDSADVNMRTRNGMTLIETALVQMTPLATDKYAVNSMFNERRSTMLNEFDALVSLSNRNTQPRFVVVHILAPHPPFVFDKDGNPAPDQTPYGYWDGSDYIDHVGSPEKYRNGYSGQAEYVGKRVLKAVDTILKDSAIKPIIMIQGDHGSKMRLDQATLDKTDVNECFPNLSAFYVPDSIRKTLYPGLTPVNSFRLVFNGLFGDSFKLRADKSWYSSFPYPYDFIDVTNRIATHDKMASVPLPNFGPRPPVAKLPGER